MGSNSSHELYQALPLRGEEFRLLILQPGQWAEEVACSLTVHSLLNKPSFEALSYTWGVSQSSEPISINNVAVAVGENLKIALRYLRSTDGPRTIWVDALCINQADNEEKGRQVQRLAQVFSSAAAILAWLGPPDSDGERALSAMGNFGQTFLLIFRAGCLQNNTNPNDNGWQRLLKLSPSDMRQLGLDFTETTWQAIWALCNRSFWRRIWIIQELALAGDGGVEPDAKNTCIIGCGSVWVPLPVIWLFVGIFGLMRGNSNWQEDIPSPPSRLLAEKGPPAIEDMYRVVRRFDSIFDDEFHSIDSLIRLLSKFQVTDPRDKLYGLLGIVKDHQVVADYSLSVSDVYKVWVRKWVKSKGNLHCILGNRQLTNNFEPSWLPELSNELVDSFVFEETIRNATCDAIGNEQPIHIDFMENILKVKGIRVGKLERIVGPSLSPLGSSESSQSWFAKLLVIIDLYSSFTEDLKEQVWRALIMETDTTNRDVPISPAPDHFRQLFQVYLNIDPVSEDFEPNLPLETRFERYVSPYAVSLDNAMYPHRCFFVTDNLRVGLGPFCGKEGDEVVSIFGSPLCFVLRPEGKGYRMIGDAYVQGVGPNRRPRDQDGSELPEEDFMIHQ
ncbi:HET-domain-containing protein [Fusarium austroafricanum]|uniref:HET-domain-containing protein n=1 Tax=Fusarium austroafricanum TaxID=2364996 RepID=A0A8H4K499_9HYPO|nr:HET-domain-containing protein [Fusarium austroafricanum]